MIFVQLAFAFLGAILLVGGVVGAVYAILTWRARDRAYKIAHEQFVAQRKRVERRLKEARGKML